MNIEEILEQFYRIDDFLAQKAIEEAVRQQEEITPHLLEILRDTIDDPEAIGEGDEKHLYALYLLAQFKETQAYPLVVELASLPQDIAEYLLGDIITEDLPAILASVSGGDISGIQKLIEDEEADEWVRSAAIGALETLLRYEMISRSELHDYYRSLYGKLEREESSVWEALVYSTALFRFEDLRPEVKKAYADELINPDFSDEAEVDQIFADKADKNYQRMLLNNPHRKMIDDAAKGLGAWIPLEHSRATPKPVAPVRPAPPPTEKKVGRNEPCPCGSGKKFKQCHGKPGA
jgi:hypothetical protein